MIQYYEHVDVVSNSGNNVIPYGYICSAGGTEPAGIARVK